MHQEHVFWTVGNREGVKKVRMGEGTKGPKLAEGGRGVRVGDW